MNRKTAASIKRLKRLDSKYLNIVCEEIKENFPWPDTEGSKFGELLSKMGPNTNPAWLVARVAEICYERDIIDAQTMDWITR